MTDDLATALNASTGNTTTSRVCSALLHNSNNNDDDEGGNLYQHLLCSDEVVQALAKGSSASYYDLTRCSPSNYDLGCLAGFFSLDPAEASQRRLFLNAFYPTVQCCPGHYCPMGVVCMIPCSAGAYCPPVRAVDNDTFCDPYGTVATPYLGCGGAVDNHACPAGSYCPNTTTTLLCPANHYCPSGSRCVLGIPGSGHETDWWLMGIVSVLRVVRVVRVQEAAALSAAGGVSARGVGARAGPGRAGQGAGRAGRAVPLRAARPPPIQPQLGTRHHRPAVAERRRQDDCRTDR
jgi:hypothetical protein